MTMPGARDWIFSAKTFASAMLALYIGFSLNLDRPYWAMATAYMVAQPLTGAMRSKGAYRFLGTLLGSVAAVALVPNLVDSPELLSLALSLWVAICLYFAMLDRTPRAYVFMLAGYTCAIIGFPSVAAPDQIFDTAFLRVEEITLGIICTTVIGTVVFPRPLGPALLNKVDAWFGYARRWSIAVLTGQIDAAEVKEDRRLLAATSVEIGMLASHVSYDTSFLQSATRPLTVLRGRIVTLLPVLAAIEDWRGELAAHGGVPAGLQALMDRIADWIAQGRDAPVEEVEALRADIRQACAAEPPAVVWQDVARVALLARLEDLVAIVLDVRALRRQIGAGGSSLPPLALPPDLAPDTTRWRDHGMALLSAAAAFVAVGLVCVVWIATAWPDGANAAMFAAVLGSFFAAQDDPTPSILRFVAFTILAVGIDAVYLFAILPRVVDFFGLALVLAPVFVVTGALIPGPATMLPALAVAVNGASLLALTDTYNADFAAFLNSAIAVVLGGATAAVVTSLMRSVGAEWSAQRLRRATWRAIAVAATQSGQPYRPTLLAGMLDRLGDLVPRVAAVEPDADAAVAAALADVRIGLSVVMLRAAEAVLPEGARTTVGAALAELARHYRQHGAERAAEGLRADIDRAITAVSGNPLGGARDALLCLVSIRHALFPSASRFPAVAG
jgi:uncharacterized membrane protein YccC